MDNSPSPDRPSPDHSPSSAEMATAVAQPSPGISKRYRPAPAKTFQCRGYGECRMVFSRSEHLARHIRKHTGERPFTCHCAKQFSRLDNLRQHAQTVHADKQDLNERMMRELTSLHASMAAANKVGNPRGGGRRPNPATPTTSHTNGNGHSINLIKQEDLSIPIHQRPGTSTGYEGDILYPTTTTWHVQTPDSRHNPNSHSFRDSSQSFLAPVTSNSSSSQSFLPFTSTLNLPDPTRDGRPRSSSSRPPTAGAPSDSRSLPPLAAVVSASLSPSSSNQPFPSSHHSHHQHHQQQFSSSQHVLPFPFPRRPSTATRPGTAPASTFYSRSSFSGGSGLVSHRPELSILTYRHHPSELGSHFGGGGRDYDPEPSQSPPGHDSPFFFTTPGIGEPSQPSAPLPSATAVGSSPSSSANPRKRSYAGPDGPYDQATSHTGHGNPNRAFDSSTALDYDYGSESRPQSRRLTVMELCNDTDAPGASSAASSLGSIFLPASATAGSRPTTSSGLVSSASALALSDRESRSQSNSPLLPRAAQATTTLTSTANTPTATTPTTTTPTTVAATAAGAGGSEEFGGNQVSAARRNVPSPSILQYRAVGSTAASSSSSTGTTGFAHSHSFSTSSSAYSPRSPGAASSSSGGTSISSFTPRSPSIPDAAPGAASAASAISRRGAGGPGGADDQVRIAVAAHHPSAPLGMRV